LQTYTVEFNRDGTPLRGHVVGRLKSSGHRFLANHGDASTLKELASGAKEPIGRSGWVRCEKGTGKNLFSFEMASRI
jgi:Thiolase-like protein type 1 additional C-terminal domain